MTASFRTGENFLVLGGGVSWKEGERFVHAFEDLQKLVGEREHCLLAREVLLSRDIGLGTIFEEPGVMIVSGESKIRQSHKRNRLRVGYAEAQPSSCGPVLQNHQPMSNPIWSKATTPVVVVDDEDDDVVVSSPAAFAHVCKQFLCEIVCSYSGFRALR